MRLRVGDDLLAEIDIGAFEPHHQRHLQADFLHRGDDAFGDDVASHDAAEDVDQDALHIGIGGDDLERRRDLFLGGAAADVEEVRRRLAIELDDVHGRHGKAGAVDHAADGAVERDVVEIVFRRLDLLGVFFGLSRSAAIVGMANSALSSKPILASRQMSLPSLVTTSGLISSRLMSLAMKAAIELAATARSACLREIGVQMPSACATVRHMMRHNAGRRIDREGHDLVRACCAPPLRYPCRLRSRRRRRRARSRGRPAPKDRIRGRSPSLPRYRAGALPCRAARSDA